MKETIRYAPPNSIIFVSDIKGGEVPAPEHWTKELIHHSASCICIGCYPEIDGETELTLAPAAEATPGPDLHLAFDGVVATPNKQLMISDIDVDGVLTAAVPDVKTRIRIWVNDPKLPDKVVIGWG